jgi:GxxExxY protein
VSRKLAAIYPHAHLTETIIGAFFDVYNALRPGLRENVYERAMVLALRDRGIAVEQQVGMKVRFGDRTVGTFRADLVVANTVLVELKALPTIERDHITQTLNALRASGLHVGLILNFGPKAQIKRVIFTRKDEAPAQV